MGIGQRVLEQYIGTRIPKKIRIAFVVVATLVIGVLVIWAVTILLEGKRAEEARMELDQVELTIPIEWTNTLNYEDLQSLCIQNCRETTSRWQNLNPSTNSLQQLADWSSSFASGEGDVRCYDELITWQEWGSETVEKTCRQQVGDVTVDYKLNSEAQQRSVELTLTIIS